MKSNNGSAPHSSSVQSGASAGGDVSPRSYAFLVFYLVVLSALGSFVNDMYTPSLPAMCRFFRCDVPVAQLGLTFGMVGLGVGQLLLGPVSDRYGRKPVLVGSVSLFIAAALASVFSPDIHFFIGCRFFQGLGASGGYFLARTVPADIYSGRRLASVMAVVGAINGFAPASAPVIGGVVADAWSWKGVFIVLAAFGGVVLLLSPLMKESLSPARRTIGHWWLGLKGYGVLLRNRAFMTHVVYKGAALGMLFAYISSSPFILQDHYDLSQTDYGIVVGINAIFVAAGSMLALRFKPLKKAARTGAVILTAGTACECVALWLIDNIWIYDICIIVMLFGLGLIFSTTNTLAMNEGRQRAGDASALLGVSGYVVGAVVSPLAGIGNVLHSTALVFIAVAVLTLVSSHFSRRLAPDLDK